MTVRSLLSGPPTSFGEQTSILDAARLMLESGNDFIILVDLDGGLGGVVSARDILRALSMGTDLNIAVSTVARRKVVTIGLDQDVSEASILMANHGISHLVVVDDNAKPKGVISARDVMARSSLHKVFAYSIREEAYHFFELGKMRLVIGKTTVTSEITWESTLVSFVVLWVGDQNIVAAVREWRSDDAFATMRDEISESFKRTELRETILRIDKHFQANRYSLRSLFRDEQLRIINRIMAGAIEKAESEHKRIYEDNYPIMRLLREISATPPKILQKEADIVVNSLIQKALVAPEIPLDSLEKLVEDVEILSIELDTEVIALEASSRVASELGQIAFKPEDILALEKLVRLVELLVKIRIQYDFWRSQNIFFSLGKLYYATMREKSQNGDESASRWIAAFDRLGDLLRIKLPM